MRSFRYRCTKIFKMLSILLDQSYLNLFSLGFYSQLVILIILGWRTNDRLVAQVHSCTLTIKYKQSDHTFINHLRKGVALA